MEAGYVACSVAPQDVIWLKSFLYHLKIFKSALDSVTIYCDKTTIVNMVKDSKYHGKTKHIKMRYHYIRQTIIEHDVILKHIFTNSIVTDPLTKRIARDAIVRHVRSYGLCKM